MKYQTIFVFLGLVLLSLAIACPVTATEYQIDPTQSTIGFQVRHMAISKTKGVFEDFAGSFSFEPGKPGTWSCEATIQTSSINTNSKRGDRTYPQRDPYGNRDDHLRSPDFFHVEKYPTMTFKSTSVEMGSDSEGCIKGYLTIRGVTKPEELDFEVLGTVTDPRGYEHAGFTATLKINREDYGLSYNRVLEAGSLIVGDEVEITLEIEGVEIK